MKRCGGGRTGPRCETNLAHAQRPPPLRIRAHAPWLSREISQALVAIALAAIFLSVPADATLYDMTATFELADASRSNYTPRYPFPPPGARSVVCPTSEAEPADASSPVAPAHDEAPHHRCSSATRQWQDHWQAPHAEEVEAGSSAAKTFANTLAQPMEAVVPYYIVLTEDAFLMDYGGTIRVSLPENALTLYRNTLSAYVNTYQLPVTLNGPAWAGDVASAVYEREGKEAVHAYGNEEKTVTPPAASDGPPSMPDMTFFAFNQPRLHCLLNAPVLFHMVATEGNRSGAVSGTCEPASLANSASESRAAATCAAFMPPAASRTPLVSTDALLTNTFMATELDLRVLLFDADTWYRLTSKTVVDAQEAGWAEDTDVEAVEPGTVSLTARGLEGGAPTAAATAAAAAQPRTRRGALPWEVYNLDKDPARVCTAPALYTIPLVELIAATSAPGYPGPGAGGAERNVGPRPDPSPRPARRAVTITHAYPPVRLVGVLAQCSGVPLSLTVRLELRNANIASGSLQPYYTSVMYFIAMVCYAILFLILLIMMFRCEGLGRAKDKARKAKPAQAVATTTTTAAAAAASARERASEEGGRHDGSDGRTGGRAGAGRRDESAQGGSGARRPRRTPHSHRSSSDESDEEDFTAATEEGEEVYRGAERGGEASSGDAVARARARARRDGVEGEPRRTARESRQRGGETDLGRTRRDRLAPHGLTDTVKSAPSRFLAAARHWWSARHIDFMLPALQWIITLMIPLKCLVVILRAAEFSRLSGVSTAESNYALQTVSLIINVCTSTTLLVLEVLVGLGWGLAYETLATGPIVVLSLACLCGFTVYTASSTCGGQDSEYAFTSNRHARGQLDLQCRAIHYVRAGVEVVFHIFSVIMLLVRTSQLGSLVSELAISAAAPLSEEVLAHLYRVDPHRTRPRHSRKGDTAGGRAARHGSTGDADRRQRRRRRRRSGSGRRHRHHHRPRPVRTDSERALEDSLSSRSMLSLTSTEGGGGSEDRLSSSYSASSRSSSSSSSSSSGGSEDGGGRPSARRRVEASGVSHAPRETSEEEARRVRQDEVQRRLLQLFLRYRSMSVPFVFVAVWPVLYLIFAFTFYNVSDYYMKVFFEELQHIYLFSIILLFMRHGSFYC